MYFAGYGAPPADPYKRAYWASAGKVSMIDMVRRQGADPNQWKDLPYCRDCLTPVKPYRIKTAAWLAKDVNLNSRDINAVRRKLGEGEKTRITDFYHESGTAKADCRYAHSGREFIPFRKPLESTWKASSRDLKQRDSERREEDNILFELSVRGLFFGNVRRSMIVLDKVIVKAAEEPALKKPTQSPIAEPAHIGSSDAHISSREGQIKRPKTQSELQGQLALFPIMSVA